ncbi:MAG: hypothetical protein K0R30_613 [Ornithinibacter sp.]|nr:hypothetical protein [Ornithinibacter sp.]
MTDRPTAPPPGDPDPQRPPQVTPEETTPTTVLPQEVAPATTAAAGPAGGPRRLWGEATSTGGGRAALVVAAILGTLLLLTGIGLIAAIAGNDGPDRGERVGMMDDRRGPGNGMGMGRGQDKKQGNGMPGGNGMGNPGQGNSPDDLGAPGLGLGRGRGGPGAGEVLHGEFTTGVTGTPTVMVVQTGVVTAYTAGQSIAVESADGFRATYSLGGAIDTPNNVPVAVGSQVRVVAAKSGMTVTRLDVLG